MQRLIDYLPQQLYHDEEHVVEFQDAVGTELQRVRAARDDLFLQLRPSTATWGMNEYEREYDIQPVRGKLQSQRLVVWRAKRRGRSTTTEELIRSIAESFANATVEVKTHHARYIMEVKLPNADSVPAYLPDMTEVIMEIRPAHLGIESIIPLNSTATAHTAARAHTRLLTPAAIPSPPPTAASRKAYTAARVHTYYRQRLG